ncbi:MAG: hypothetical protein LQ341_003403 [Variospora aurantia]|nr:MAG: hypothetical protein LQ341_003403 [Variospora aurantia]
MDTNADVGDPGATESPPVTSLPASWGIIRDELETETSVLQDETVRECLPFLNGSVGAPQGYNEHGLPSLARDEHIKFLHHTLETMPPAYVGFDASRPWIIYWALTALSLLGEDVEPYCERVTQTLSSMQNASGGFGGGHGQISHCAPSYAAVLSLALVGRSESLELVDRKALWHWLGQVKQRDGGFRVCVGGEEDVRGGYCAMVMISLLKLPLTLPPDALARQAGLQTFADGLPEYLSRCEDPHHYQICPVESVAGQTFEGGISGSPQTEAHGAYAFCALACLSILGPPHKIIPRFPDGYHTCYTLAGLSSAQHHVYYGRSQEDTPSVAEDDAFQWASLPRSSVAGKQTEPEITEAEDRLVPIHPIYVIPWPAVERAVSWYQEKGDF